ncbi:Peptidase family S41 [Shewanella psychrophila]|uniref:Peptidase family S41 n=1 Tax=Shewanella psychrophila TaxID=225848 RepID=A0A1S6HR10_9GAMM|nr:S41 family peptidase [Shewanella psychrophila]AQS37942.1 Peptidase family S41 [Shewanella psychrophila]
MRFGFPQIVNVFGLCLLISTLQLARLTLYSVEYKTRLTQSEMHQDLDVLINEVRLHSAFAALDEQRFAKIEADVEPLVYRATNSLESQYFYAEVVKLLATLEDPGAIITSPNKPLPVLPVILKPVADSWLALDGNAVPIDPDHPFITHIDGLPLSRWEQTSQKFISNPVNKSVSERVHWLSQLNILRRDMGLPLKSQVTLSLSDNLDSNIQLVLPVAKHQVHPPRELISGKMNSLSDSGTTSQPVYASIELLSNYDRDSELVAKLERGAQQALTIIDLRNAVGDSDELLHFIARHYPNPETTNNRNNAPQRLMALGQYRRSIDFKSDFLRPLGFIPFDEFNFFEQLEFRQTSQTIDIDKAERFGLWYGRRSPLAAEFHYDESYRATSSRLGLIIGPECRRECEWVAYFAKSLSRVTLIGEKTSGDLGRRYGFTLPNSGIKVELTASLTYNMQGKLLSSVGTQPDIPLPITEVINWQGLLSLIESEQQDRETVYTLNSPDTEAKQALGVEQGSDKTPTTESRVTLQQESHTMTELAVKALTP